MRTRRTPAPHPSRPRAASLRRVVAAALALPLALGTLAATAIPASADTVDPTITFTNPPLTLGKSNPATITCPTDTSFPLESAAWQTSSAGWGPATQTLVEDHQVTYSADVRFNSAGRNQIAAICYYADGVSRSIFVYLDADPAAPVVAPTTTTVKAFPTVVEPGNPIQVETTVLADQGTASGGTVQFSLDGNAVGGPVEVSSHGYASTSIPNPGYGTYTVGASYSGTESFEASNGQTEVRVKAKTSVAAVIPDQVRAPSTTLRASVAQAAGAPAPTGTVEFRYSEGARLGKVPLVDGTAVLPLPDLAPGLYPDVIAVYSGDENYGNAGSVYRDMVVLAPLPPVQHRMPSEVKVGAPATAVTGSTVEIKVAVSHGVQRTSTQVAEPAFPTGTAIIELADGAVKRKATLVDGIATFSVVAPAPGSYTVYAYYNGDDIFDASTSSTELVVTPPAPVTPEVTVPATVTTSVATPATFTVGFPGKVRPAGVLTVTAGPTTLVSPEVPVSGDLAVTLPVLAPGTYDLVVRTAASQGVLATEQAVRVTVLGEPAKGSTTPDADLTGSTTTLQTGKKITLEARGFQPGETVAFYLHSDPVFLGTAVADDNGVATLVVALPAGVPTGQHHVQATGGTSGRWAEIPVTVTEGTPAVETPVEAGPIVTVPVAVPTTPVAAAPATAAPVAPAAAPLAATGADLGATALLVSVLLGSGALLLAGRRRFATSAR